MDIEDMEQEAEVAYWRNTDKGDAYAFVCARNAALQWFYVYVNDWKRHDKPAQATPQNSAIHLSDKMAETVPMEIWQENAKATLDLEQLPLNQQDKNIVRTILQGHSNEGIAFELGLAPASVKRYRSRIRKILEKMAKGSSLVVEKASQ
jgi:ATP/maltotriose-dependent transcriptional regulator MalT